MVGCAYAPNKPANGCFNNIIIYVHGLQTVRNNEQFTVVGHETILDFTRLRTLERRTLIAVNIHCRDCEMTFGSTRREGERCAGEASHNKVSGVGYVDGRSGTHIDVKIWRIALPT